MTLEPMLEAIDDGTLGGEIYELNLENGGLKIEFNENYDAPDEVHDEVDRVIEGIIDGSIDVAIPE